MSHSLPLDVDELAIVFGYKNRGGVNRAVRKRKFPIPTYVYRGRRFAHPDHVNEWLDARKIQAEKGFKVIPRKNARRIGETTGYDEWDD